MKMYYLIGGEGRGRAMLMSSPQEQFLKGLSEVLKEKFPEMRMEIIVGINYEEFIEREKKRGTVKS